MFGFRPGDEDRGRDVEFTSVKLLDVGDVLGGLVLQAFVQIAPVMNPLDFAQLLFRVGVKVGAILFDGEGQENFGRQAGDFDLASLEEFGALADCDAQGQAAAPSCFNFSVWK
jgi:hypothetical protein